MRYEGAYWFPSPDDLLNTRKATISSSCHKTTDCTSRSFVVKE